MPDTCSKPLPRPRVRQAVILVGGKGTRLGDLTRARPKPMMQITHDRCFLDYMIENLARQGFNRITLLAGYLGDQVVTEFQGQVRRGAHIEVIVEAQPMGTGGALREAAPLLEERFLLLNGDTFFDIAYRSLEAVSVHQAGVKAVMALRQVPDCARYGSVRLSQGRISAFVEKNASEADEGLINAGIYLLDRSIIDYIPLGVSSLETDVFPALVAADDLAGCELDGYFIDIGLPDTLAEARAALPRRYRRPALFLDRDGVINADHGYVHQWNQFDWVAGATEVISAFNAAGYFVFVVTNQAGVAHGYYKEDAIHLLHEQVQDRLAEAGAHVDAFYYCPYHPAGALAEYRRHHDDRKPGPGMLNRALADWPVEPVQSFLIGDKESDISAARSAGLDGLLFPGGNLLEFLQTHDRLPPQVTRCG